MYREKHSIYRVVHYPLGVVECIPCGEGRTIVPQGQKMRVDYFQTIYLIHYQKLFFFSKVMILKIGYALVTSRSC